MMAPRLPAGAGLPAGLVPPVKVALARAVTRMPQGGALPGTLLYEPKWDGYRAVGIRDDNGATLWSRQGKDLTRYSVGVSRRRSDLWPGESAVISARQVSLTDLSMSTSFRTTRTPWLSITPDSSCANFEPSRKFVRGAGEGNLYRTESRNGLAIKPLTIRGVVRRRLSRLVRVKRKRLHQGA